jgi:hypothetical protein
MVLSRMASLQTPVMVGEEDVLDEDAGTEKPSRHTLTPGAGRQESKLSSP